ncbi:MAG: hypothetical protein SCK70_00355 [bacterium]|nr:hypothetical protein [bacterium]
MDQNQVAREITIIKQMIEKTKRETAESGHLFIFMGIATALFVLCVGLLELFQLSQWILPAMIILTIVNGFIGFLVVTKSDKSERVKTYPKTVVLNLWVICGLTLVLLTFLFPFLKVYPFSALGVIASLILGIAVFVTGVIYEMRSILWLSSAWWIGAILLALIKSPFSFFILIATIIVGWIFPGFIINRQYKNGSK